MKTSRQINIERKKDGLPPLNFALFRKVIKKLEIAPEAYEQTTYGERDSDAPCGTAACIAGWATVLSGNAAHTNIRRLHRKAQDIATKELGINYEESRTLFGAEPYGIWPEPFDLRWARALTRKSQARVAISYLKRILKTGKVNGIKPPVT